MGEFSLADIPMMAVAMVLQVDGLDTSGFPKVTAYFSRLCARSGYAASNPDTPLADG